MSIQEVEIQLSGMPHTVQTNPADPANERFVQPVQAEEKAAPKPKNKAAKPSSNKSVNVNSDADTGATE